MRIGEVPGQGEEYATFKDHAGSRRVRKSIDRLVTAYQEELITIDELRDRTPELRRQEQALHRELQSAVDRAQDRETYLRLAETLTGFLARLRSSAETLDIAERQRIVRLLVKEILVTEDKITIRHSIPISGSPGGGPDPSKRDNGGSDDESYLLRSGRHRPDPRRVPRAEAMTPWTAARERRNSRAMAAGLNPASWAARISRTCPAVTPAAPADAPVFARADFAGPGLPGRDPLSESSGMSRPRRRASSVTAFVSRSSCSSSSRRSDFPRSAGRARRGALAGRPMSGARDAASVVSARDPPILSRRVIVPSRSRFPCVRSPRARKAFTVPGADGRKDNRYGFPP